MVQKYEVWNLSGAWGKETYDLYELGDAELVDLFTMTPFSVLRSNLIAWDVSPSDVTGCVQATSPKKCAFECASGLALLLPGCPLVFTVDELERRHWVVGRRKDEPHLPEDEALTFNMDKPWSKKDYTAACSCSLPCGSLGSWSSSAMAQTRTTLS